ncbi:hypothetical protein VIBHAR_03563 [Vibrio campbellii ATCC BAA-1116]|uniref:Uncharacterized protein n=1 Tax=Vibrio campbellii (strain ATCC BAA-1116) TaxID=2902295 RepID=A7MTQ4_VIBC1|nr:hypothetical protein VIBHAR_03563 [Vibrio campbellii ATCC BAA-1116]
MAIDNSVNCYMITLLHIPSVFGANFETKRISAPSGIKPSKKCGEM